MLEDVTPIVPDGTLAGKIIIITGASQGVGEAAAKGFARAGASVVLCARRGAIVADLAAHIERQGGTAMGLEADVASEDSVKRLIDAAGTKYGRIDGLFNNAGVDPKMGALCDMDFEEWKYTHDVKIHGTFLCMKHAIPVMIASGGGAIVNNGSVVAHRAFVPAPFAASSQAAILGLTKVAAATYAKANIRVNMLSTGGIMTEERLAHDYDGKMEAIAKTMPMGRFGRPSEDAQVAAWLLSDYASYVTGADIAVDGGHLVGYSI
jgi:NAD(P)-dependent dehydrogenase (short-subunit alcohol dehydrogenase family)